MRPGDLPLSTPASPQPRGRCPSSELTSLPLEKPRAGTAPVQPPQGPLPAPAAQLLSAGTRAGGPWKGSLPCGRGRGGGAGTPDSVSQLEALPLETGNPKSCCGAWFPFRLMRWRRELYILRLILLCD